MTELVRQPTEMHHATLEAMRGRAVRVLKMTPNGIHACSANTAR